MKSHHAEPMLEALLWYVYVCLPTGFNQPLTDDASEQQRE